MIATSSTLICTPAKCSCSSGSRSLGKRRFSAPNTPCDALLKKIAMPMVAIIGIRCGALRRRSGLSTSTSISSPTTPLTRNAASSAAQSGNDSLETSLQRRIRADHEDRAVRQVDHPEHAEHQREAEREQRIDAAQRQGVDELLFEHRALPTACSRYSGGANAP